MQEERGYVSKGTRGLELARSKKRPGPSADQESHVDDSMGGRVLLLMAMNSAGIRVRIESVGH